ncbi:MAG: hypothetical protein QOH06_2490 [Acidobacteriota bacterium]|jgi:hypothetical protein|nr:hypothetical protein [Acidobacteriota bacterium]
MEGQGEPLFDPDEWQEIVDPERVEKELQALRPRHLIDQLARSLEWCRLCELIEERGFLAEMAEAHGFQRPGEDVEEHVLACAIKVGDWDRFVRFAALACNLRALAEDLAAPEILRALTQSDRIPLALDIAARIAEPIHRAEARAVIASACGSGREPFGALRRAISEDLQEVAATGIGEEPEARARVQSLITIGRLLGPELDALWPLCLSKLAPESEHPRIRQAIAAAWLDRGDLHNPGLWNALEAVSDPRLLLEIAPEALAALALDDPQAILKKLGALFRNEPKMRRLALATFLGRLARSHSELALSAWEDWAVNEPVPWSAQLVEAGRDVIVRLDPNRLEDLYAKIEDSTARAALRVVDLEHRRDHGKAAAALAAVGEIPDGPERLHWSLRYVAARPCGPIEEVRNQVGAIAGFLYEVRYEAPAGDLRRFLDLVALFREDELKAQLESVVWSPASHPDTLLTLARETTCEKVADLLLEDAERYAAAASPSAAEGFQLRKELLIRATSRLCLLRQSTRDLDRVIGRLLPEEEDELRAILAPQLRSREVAEGIRDRRRRLLALLESIPIKEARGDLLTAQSLYRSMARVDVLEDEIRGISTLLELPFDLSGLAEKHVGAIQETSIRLQTLLRLAWHSLAFQESFYGGRPDRAAAIEMVRSAFNADTDSRLVAVTPQVAELGAQVGGGRAVAEFQEAARRLARLDSVPWSKRLETLERLLAPMPSIFLAPRQWRGARKAAEVLEAVARLPLQTDAGAALEEIRTGWHEVLPILTATLDRLPKKVAPRVLHAFRKGLAFPIDPRHARLFDLCLLPPGERLKEASRRLSEPSPDLEEVRALVYLLAIPAPETARAALERLPAGAERDELGLRLIRNSWLPPEQNLALRSLFSIPEALQRADVWLSPDQDSWYPTLAALAARGEVDPSSPEHEPLVRLLWKRSSPKILPDLGKAVREALRTGGRERGEIALRLWLHARLAPELGTAQGDRARWAEGACAALKRALELGSTVNPGG